MEMLLVSLPMILVFGLATSYSDIRRGIISNRWIFASISYAFLVVAFSAYYAISVGEAINVSYMFDFAANVAASSIFGFLLWKAGVWAAGDGKLFIAYSALLPLSVYSIGYVRFFPSFTIFINTIIPAMAFLLACLFAKAGLRGKLRSAVKIFKPRSILEDMVTLFGISWIIIMPFSYLGIGLDAFAFLILIPSACILLNKLAGSSIRWVYAVVFILRLIFDRTYILSPVFFAGFAVMTVLYILMKYVIFDLSYDIFSKSVKVDELRKGMSLANRIVKENGRYVARSWRETAGQKAETFFSGTLRQKDIVELKRLRKSLLVDDTLRVSSSMPFALFMLLGAMLTVALNGNMIIAVKNLLGL